MQTMTSTIAFIDNIDDYLLEFERFVDDLLTVIYKEIYHTNYDHIMLDVGANKGLVTAIMLKHLDTESGKVIAFDAHPCWLDKFAFREHPKVEKNNLACYSCVGKKKFIDEDTMTGLGYIGLSPVKHRLNVKNLKSFIVNCDTLDNLVKTDKKISFIKIDTESSDFEVILGAEKIIKDHRPFILFEFSGQIFERAHNHTRNDFLNFFTANHYNLYSIGLGKTIDYIVKFWDIENFNFCDILAIPTEHSKIVSST